MLDRLKTLARAARAACSRLRGHHHAPAISCGLALGVAGWSAAHAFVATFGFSRETTAALLLATSVSFSLGLRFLDRRRSASLHGLPMLFTAGWLVLLPIILSFAESLVAAVPVSLLAGQPALLALLMAAGLIALGVPSFCAGIVTGGFRRRGDGATLVIAAGLGTAANALLLAPFLGLQVPLLCVAVSAAVLWFVRMIRGTTDEVLASAESSSRDWAHARNICSAAVAAMLCGVCARVLVQLTPEASYLIGTGVAAFLSGTGTGAILAGRHRIGRFDAARRLGAAITALAALLPLAAFPWLVERHLDANAYVSTVFWLMAIRTGTVAAVFLPIGLGCGLMLAPAGGRIGLIMFASALGLAAAAWLTPLAGVMPLTIIAGSALILLNAGPIRSTVPRTRRGGAVAAAWGVGLVAIGLNAGHYEPVRAARLLFSTEAFVARQHGVPTELLPWLDDTRLAGTFERAGGTVTLWKQRGDGLVIRANGVPVAATSTSPDRCPLPTAEVLRVVLPLALHDAPGSLLLLGDPAGLATATAAAFPLREIVCYDPADGVRDAADRGVGAANDDRVARAAVEPCIAVAAEHRTFDVVVSDPGMPSLPSAVPFFTREFYARAAARLTPNGIFCQRLRYADLGPAPLRVLAATTRGAFGDSMIIEIGSGEYVLLGTRTGSMLIRTGLVARLQRPHVRRILAALGWDWCVPLNLTSVDRDGLHQLAKDAPGVNTASNGLLACTLPQEVMRWGLKSQEMQQATATVTTRLLARGVPEAEQRDVLDRIAEVTGQHRLMTEYPDQPWAYRKEVRTQLKETPRSVIQPVAGEIQRVMHPDNRRRLDYFVALGEAARQPREETLSNLERFAEPYDPLLTYFLHHEAAPLYARLGPAGQAGELAHRLHAAYFADLRDRSVRNEIAAMELIVANPDLVPDEADRFDQLNGLIEVLLGRWEARGMAQPKSPAVVMVDIDKTLGATDAAVKAMGPLAASAGLTDEQWQLRKAAIERTLTRPLRTYRTTLLPHVRAAQRETEKSE